MILGSITGVSKLGIWTTGRLGKIAGLGEMSRRCFRAKKMDGFWYDVHGFELIFVIVISIVSV